MKNLILVLGIFVFNISNGQVTTTSKSDFWQKVRFGGGFGVNFGNNSTNINLAPALIYNFNEKYSLGASLQGSYVDVKNSYTSLIYGASIMGFANALPNIQLSGEIEQLRVNTTFESSKLENIRWNTAVFLGAGYTSNNMTFGVRYNVLHNDSSIYSEAWMPFFRVLF